MVAAVRVHKPGGPEVLTYEDVQIAAPAGFHIGVPAEFLPTIFGSSAIM